MLYVIGRALFRTLFRVVYRYRVEGLERVPQEGGVLLVANHASLLDPPLVGSAMRRPVNFMAKAELFKIPLLGWILPKVKAFPVQRGGADRAAVRESIERLQKGEVVCLFPEGTRTKTGQMLPLQRGAGLIAMRADVPIVPVGLIGTFKPWKGRLFPKRMIVRFGTPLDVSSLAGEDRGRDAIERLNAMMHAGIEALLGEDASHRA